MFATNRECLLTLAEIIYNKSDTSPVVVECVNDIINVVANNIDNQNVCEMHNDDTGELENTCNENLKEIHSRFGKLY